MHTYYFKFYVRVKQCNFKFLLNNLQIYSIIMFNFTFNIAHGLFICIIYIYKIVLYIGLIFFLIIIQVMT